MPTTRLGRVSKSFVGRCICFYNMIPKNVQNICVTKFQRIVKKRLCGKVVVLAYHLPSADQIVGGGDHLTPGDPYARFRCGADAGNAPVIPLLQENVGGGDHLTLGDPYACFFQGTFFNAQQSPRTPSFKAKGYNNPYARLPSFSIKKSRCRLAVPSELEAVTNGTLANTVR
ncbi:unnamed protein product [Leptidea sinapis]|uniref:Uncharacterized protein n=1 Tax=Leptidea sinapis TaxID=189913 RepID=A0A5E4PTH5_9NEOP|nr:unnamed protein product [Leptidea sinapis]